MTSPKREGTETLVRSKHAESALLTVDHVRLGYSVDGAFTLAVQDVSFDIRAGEKIILLGPSGCGKSTLLKAIGGFLPIEAGRISVRGVDSPTPGPDRAIVFQEFDQLFPWRTVLGNITYPLRRNGHSKKSAEERGRHYLEMMGLSIALDRFPHQLSGGMKQRVSIARAFALEPLMLLMDEPFGSLDALTRTKLQLELNRIANQTDVTILFVTHSIEEAIVLGDRIIVLGQPPSEVKEIVAVTDEVKCMDSDSYHATRRHLRQLLNVDGEEAHSDTPFD